tara:strand:+ start:133 stop:2568 length:2436 start_codon:yes stop_codon:yes gene_type:complete
MVMIRDMETNEQDEVQELSEEQQIYSRIDSNERQVKRSAIAYHMVHSGHIFNINDGPNAGMRAQIVNDMVVDGISRLEELGEEITSTTRDALSSYHTQIRNSENPNMPVFMVDVSAIDSGLILPQTQPEDSNFNTPNELSSVGIDFNDWAHLRRYYNDFSTLICTSPDTMMFWLQKYQWVFIDIADPTVSDRAHFHRVKPEWRISNTPEHTSRSFHDILQAQDVGRLVKVNGQVTEVGDIMVVMTHIAYRCVEPNDIGLECGHIVLQEQKQDEQGVLKPDNCSVCGKNHYVKMDSRESKSEAMQRLVIQEEDIGGEARSIMVEMRGNLCDMDLAGSTISVTGVVKVEPIAKNSTVCKPFLLASDFSLSNNSDTTLYVTPRDMEEITSFQEENDMETRMEMISHSWAGHIHAADDVKQAILLQAFGCPSEELFGHKGEIRIFIVGDPGTAKTKLLKLATDLRLGSRYTTAESASQAGLIGGCQQVEDLYTGRKRWAVTPGEIPLTDDDAVCAVDEFNLYKGDFGDFNTAMESGEIVISKIAKARIRTNCSIIAGANPKSKDANRKKFSKNNQVPYAMQIGLDFTTLQRFDAIYVLEDSANEDTDENIANSMLGAWVDEEEQTTSENNLTLDFIRKLISVGRNQRVRMSKPAANYIAKSHAQKRKESSDDETLRSHRQVASLARFSLAAARFDGVGLATLKHVRFAEKVLESTLQEKDPGVIDGGMSEDARTLRREVAEAYVKLIESGFTLDDHTIDELYSAMSEEWPDIPTMDRIEKVMKSFSQNRNITNIYILPDGTYSYKGVNNPPIGYW